MKLSLATAATALALLVAAPASATILVTDLTIDGATGGLGVLPPFGTVTVDDAGGVLTFNVSLLDDLRFRNSPDSNHFSFAFNLGGLSANIGSITDNGTGTFASVPGPVNQSPFGSFQYALDCNSGCITGYNAASPSQLNFVVTGAGALTVANLTATSSANYGNVLFAADVVSPGGFTGNVGGGGGGGIPEPATWGLMLLGFGGMGAMLRNRRRQVAATA
jgi:hypothetical protein